MPFTHDQFLDVFSAYNTALWPAALLLWVVTARILPQWVRKGPERSPMMAALLAVHWAWSGVAYHLAFFRHINPAASLFGIIFLVQAAAFVWFGVVRRTLRWQFDASLRGVIAMVLIGYGMLYPVIGIMLGLRYPRMPVFGVPCPTTLVTAGVLLLAVPGSPRVINLIPLAWCVVGGSGAFLLGIRADLALIVAGVLLVVQTLAPALASGSGSGERVGR